MKRERGPLALLCLSFGTLCVLLSLYAGAYYSVVQPTVAELSVARPGTTDSFVYEEYVFPVYPDGLWLDGNLVFAPMHTFDRWLRPRIWTGRVINRSAPALTVEGSAEQES